MAPAQAKYLQILQLGAELNFFLNFHWLSGLCHFSFCRINNNVSSSCNIVKACKENFVVLFNCQIWFWFHVAM